MQVHLGALGLPGPVALTIGNFDGVHRGHQAMLGKLLDAARLMNIPSAVMSFEPHPRDFFAPLESPPRITSLREKASCLREAGVDHLIVCRFNRAFAKQTAEEFMNAWLIDKLKVKWLLTGDDFRFGAKRMGDVLSLKNFGAENGIEVHTQETVIDGEDRVSSSLIRDCLSASNLERAEKLLGHAWRLEGRVVQGDALGRQWGFPTANIDFTGRKLPVTGIFAVRFHRPDGSIHEGVASLGTRPTVIRGGRQLLEVFLLDFSGSLYGEHVSVELLHKFRDELRFESIEDLKIQIAQDVADARHYFEHERTQVLSTVTHE